MTAETINTLIPPETERFEPRDLSPETRWGGITPVVINESNEELEDGGQQVPNMHNPLLTIATILEKFDKEEVLIRGQENVPQEGGFILAFSHVDTVDSSFVGNNPFFWIKGIYKTLNNKRPDVTETRIIATNTLKGIRRWVVEKSNGIFVEPDHPILNTNTISEAAEVVSKGGVVLIAPEGRRADTLLEGKSGVGKIALLAAIKASNMEAEHAPPVVPVAFYQEPGKKHLVFGEPINTDKYATALARLRETSGDTEARKLGLEYARQIAQETMQGLATLLPEKYIGGEKTT